MRNVSYKVKKALNEEIFIDNNRNNEFIDLRLPSEILGCSHNVICEERYYGMPTRAVCY